MEKAKKMFHSIKVKLDSAIQEISKMNRYSNLFSLKNGKPIYTISSLRPKTKYWIFFSFSYFLLYDGYNRTETLINQLLLAVKEIEERENIEIEIPKKNGAVSVSVWNWKFLKNKHPFISAWLEIEVLFK